MHSYIPTMGLVFKLSIVEYTLLLVGNKDLGVKQHFGHSCDAARSLLSELS